MDKVELRGSVADALRGYELTDPGYASGEVFRATADDRPSLWLKARTALGGEKDRLEWLSGRVPVPEVVAYEPALVPTDEVVEELYEDQGPDLLVLTEVPGLPASDVGHEDDVERVVDALVAGLHAFHSLPVEGCPFDATVGIEVPKAWERVLFGDADRDTFQSALALLPNHEDLVVTHGDYCLPNVLVADGKLGGFVDVGRCGVADRHRDVALAGRSLRRNWGEEWVGRMLDAYGEALDVMKLDFFLLLDELL